MKPPRRLARAIAATIVSLTLVLGPAPRAEEPSAEFRGLWISRFNWSDPAAIPGMIDQAADAGFNAIFWQVRGESVALYASELEPLDARCGQGDDRVDPLAIALEAARKRGLKLHAWMNCLTGWKGKTPPDDPAHLWNARRDWFAAERPANIVAEKASAIAPSLVDDYAFLSPASPDLRAHLAAVAAEIVGKYDVDGLCFDYIRYKNLDQGWEACSLNPYGADPRADPNAWRAYRRERLDELVGAMSSSARAARPGVLLSAAVWGDYDEGRLAYLQDSHAWLGRGWLDFLCPMAYFVDPAVFATQAGLHQHDRRGRAVVPAIGAYLMKDAGHLLAEQVEATRRLGTAGYSVYEYGALFGDAAKGDCLAAAKERQAGAATAPDFPWARRRAAGDDDSDGPWFEDFSSDSPIVKAGGPLRVGALISDASGIDVSSENAPRAEFADDPEFENAASIRLEAIGGDPTSRGLFVTVEPFAAPDDPAAVVYARAVARDGDFDETEGGPAEDAAIGYSATLRFRPVLPVEEYRFSGFFGAKMDGARYPAFVPPNQLWVSSEGENCVRAFASSGGEKRFSPIRDGKGPGNETVQILRPGSIVLDPKDNKIWVASSRGDKTLLMKFDEHGRAFPGVELPVPASAIDVDAIGQIYAADATRRRWRVYSRNGALLGGPYGPFDAEDPRFDSPALQAGIAVTADGRRVFVACLSARLVDVYDLLNAPDERAGEVKLEAPHFAWNTRPLCPIGPRGAAVDIAPDGRLFVSDGDHRVQVWSPDGGRHEFDVWSVGPPLRYPQGIAFFPTGGAFFAAINGGDLTPGTLHLWRKKTDFDPPVPNP